MRHWLKFSGQHGHWVFLNAVLCVMFRGLLPVAARLPLRAGMLLADGMGWVCGWLDLDWRTVALRTHYVKHRTRLALQEISPDLNADDINRALNQRFVNASREELEGHWLALGRADECRCEFEGLEAVRSHLAQQKGLVLLTLHFDAALMGVVQLGRAGLKLNLMTSNVVEDARVMPAVQRYFAKKYAGITRSLNGGQALHVESHLKTFYAGLRRGEGLVVLGEAPTDRLDEAVLVNFLGQRRAIAPGALRIAEKTQSAMAAFVCLRVSAGHYRVVLSPLLFSSASAGHRANVETLFAFLAQQVRAAPGRWWAADQLPNFVNVPDDDGVEER